MSETPSPSAARTDVVAAALELFERQGFEATSVEQIAQAAGVSRSTFFRQFGGKEDVVFADHEVLLERAARVAREGARRSVGGRVRGIRAGVPPLRRRPRGRPPALPRRAAGARAARARDRHGLPLRAPLRRVPPHQRARARSARRRRLRGARDGGAQPRAAPAAARRPGAARRCCAPRSTTCCGATACIPTASDAADDDVVVAVFPRRMPPAEVTRRLRDRLD